MNTGQILLLVTPILAIELALLGLAVRDLLRSDRHVRGGNKPLWALVIVFVSLLGPIIYLTDDSQYTLAVGLSNFVSTQSNQTNLLMAANLITIIPVAVLYFFAQKQLIGGIASVGLK